MDSLPSLVVRSMPGLIVSCCALFDKQGRPALSLGVVRREGIWGRGEVGSKLGGLEGREAPLGMCCMREE